MKTAKIGLAKSAQSRSSSAVRRACGAPPIRFARRRPSSIRRSTSCSAAAATSSTLRGKWCACAPADTPASSATRRVVVCA